MSSLATAHKFISLVEIHFPAPKFNGDESQEELWTDSIAQILGPYDDDVVLDAAATIVRTRRPKTDGTMFPKPSECIEACDNAKARKQLAQTPLLETASKIKERQERDPHAAWRRDRVALAVDLCRTELGQRAGREGWILQLYDFCRDYARPAPTASSMRWCALATRFSADVRKSSSARKSQKRSAKPMRAKSWKSNCAKARKFSNDWPPSRRRASACATKRRHNPHDVVVRCHDQNRRDRHWLDVR